MEYFPQYADEYEFIVGHTKHYGQFPDRETIIAEFPDFQFFEVTESDRFLLDKIREEHLYHTAVPILQTYAEKLKADSNDAVEYLLDNVQALQPQYAIAALDIMANAVYRQRDWEERQNNGRLYIPTGFEEFDRVFGGWSTFSEEFVLLFARTGQGKSWILDYCASVAWRNGYRVGIFSPEMSANKVGYRLDTFVGHFSNSGLVRALPDRVNAESYRKYAESMSGKSGLFVTTMEDFGGTPTVAKMRGFIRQNNLDMLCIDGLSYMKDAKQDSRITKTDTLTNISTDFVLLSKELGVPVLAAHQANRAGIKVDDEIGLPEIENVKDSDGISHNATKIISLKQSGNVLTMGIKKHRDGETGMIFNYDWNIDMGQFVYKRPENKRKQKEKEKAPSPRTRDKDVVF